MKKEAGQRKRAGIFLAKILSNQPDNAKITTNAAFKRIKHGLKLTLRQMGKTQVRQNNR